jgi:hypothetical protein
MKHVRCNMHSHFTMAFPLLHFASLHFTSLHILTPIYFPSPHFTTGFSRRPLFYAVRSKCILTTQIMLHVCSKLCPQHVVRVVRTGKTFGILVGSDKEQLEFRKEVRDSI